MRIALLEDCGCLGPHPLAGLADSHVDCSGCNKSGNLREEKKSLDHHQSLVQPDSCGLGSEFAGYLQLSFRMYGSKVPSMRGCPNCGMLINHTEVVNI